MSRDDYAAWRARVHGRVCTPARSCTCPEALALNVEAARERARHAHARFSHLGPVESCQSPDDVICKAVWT